MKITNILCLLQIKFKEKFEAYTEDQKQANDKTEKNAKIRRKSSVSDSQNDPKNFEKTAEDNFELFKVLGGFPQLVVRWYTEMKWMITGSLDIGRRNVQHGGSSGVLETSAGSTSTPGSGSGKGYRAGGRNSRLDLLDKLRGVNRDRGRVIGSGFSSDYSRGYTGGYISYSDLIKARKEKESIRFDARGFDTVGDADRSIAPDDDSDGQSVDDSDEQSVSAAADHDFLNPRNQWTKQLVSQANPRDNNTFLSSSEVVWRDADSDEDIDSHFQAGTYSTSFSYYDVYPYGQQISSTQVLGPQPNVLYTQPEGIEHKDAYEYNPALYADNTAIKRRPLQDCWNDHGSDGLTGCLPGLPGLPGLPAPLDSPFCAPGSLDTTWATQLQTAAVDYEVGSDNGAERIRGGGQEKTERIRARERGEFGSFAGPIVSIGNDESLVERGESLIAQDFETGNNNKLSALDASAKEVSSKRMIYFLDCCIICLTLINGGVLCFDSYPHYWFSDQIDNINFIITALFAMELILRVYLTSPMRHYSEVLNWIDSFVILYSVFQELNNLPPMLQSFQDPLGYTEANRFRVLKLYRLFLLCRVATYAHVFKGAG